MNDETLTHEKVDELEGKLRKAQEILEEAAQMVCDVRGEYGPHLWNRLTSLANDVGDTFCGLYRLRPY
jgi:hypothetical protein